MRVKGVIPSGFQGYEIDPHNIQEDLVNDVLLKCETVIGWTRDDYLQPSELFSGHGRLHSDFFDLYEMYDLIVAQTKLYFEQCHHDLDYVPNKA